MLRATFGFFILLHAGILLLLGTAHGQPRRSPEPVSASVAIDQLARAEALSAKYNLGWYGNWCGGGHGGYQDCCNGTACPACVTDITNECNAGANETWKACHPTKECLKECPAVDEMDLACAGHDSCCIRNRLPPSLPSCYPEGNYCWCDCNLVSGVIKSTCSSWACSSFRSLLIEAFEYTLACWAYPVGNWTSQPYCNGVINRKQPVGQYCNATF